MHQTPCVGWDAAQRSEDSALFHFYWRDSAGLSQVNKPPLTCRKHGQSSLSSAVTPSQICSLGTEFLLPKQVICWTRPLALWGDFPWDCGNPRCQSPQGVSQRLPSWPGKSRLSIPCSHWTWPPRAHIWGCPSKLFIRVKSWKYLMVNPGGQVNDATHTQ